MLCVSCLMCGLSCVWVVWCEGCVVWGFCCVGFLCRSCLRLGSLVSGVVLCGDCLVLGSSYVGDVLCIGCLMWGLCFVWVVYVRAVLCGGCAVCELSGIRVVLCRSCLCWTCLYRGSLVLGLFCVGIVLYWGRLMWGLCCVWIVFQLVRANRVSKTIISNHSGKKMATPVDPNSNFSWKLFHSSRLK